MSGQSGYGYGNGLSGGGYQSPGWNPMQTAGPRQNAMGWQGAPGGNMYQPPYPVTSDPAQGGGLYNGPRQAANGPQWSPAQGGQQYPVTSDPIPRQAVNGPQWGPEQGGQQGVPPYPVTSDQAGGGNASPWGMTQAAATAAGLGGGGAPMQQVAPGTQTVGGLAAAGQSMPGLLGQFDPNDPRSLYNRALGWRGA